MSRDGSRGITILKGKCELVTINNIFNQMDWKKVLLKDIGEFRDVLVKTDPTKFY